MNAVESVEQEWCRAFAELGQGEFLQMLARGTLGPDLYRGFLRETYHNVALNPRIGCLFLSRMQSAHAAMEARLLKHIASELGHDALALNDLKCLGEDPEGVKRGRPLPSTEALAAFVTFQIEYRHPLAYLGYIYHLEALAERIGGQAMAALVQSGIPTEAMSFLREHAENDPVHMRFNQDYLKTFVRTEADLEAVLYGARGACRLYASMFQGIVEDERRKKGDWNPGAGHVTDGRPGFARGRKHG